MLGLSQIGINLAIVLVSLPARAATRYSLDHSAPPGCPSAEELRARVLERESASSTAPNVATPNAPARVRVVIEPSPGGLRGWVEVEDRGYRVRRVVEGADCNEVTSAIAVIIGIALDHRAAPETVPEVTSERRDEPARARFGIGIGAMTHRAPAPEPIIGPLLVLTYEKLRGSASATSLSVGHARSDLITTRGGDAQFWFSRASLAACPWRWTPHAVAALGPCLRLDVGALRGRGSSTSRPRDSTGFWLAPGGSVDWILRLDHLAFGASAGLSFPLVRDRFAFLGPELIVAHHPPPTDARAELWAGLSFGK